MSKKLTNPWIRSYQRSYQSIKAQLLEDLANIKDDNGNQLITDLSDGNILVIILSMFAAIAETLHFYIDNAAQESFLSTARKYDSVVKLGRLVDYHPKAATAARVDVRLNRNSSATGDVVTIPKGTEFQDTAGNTWLSTRPVTLGAYVDHVNIPLIQHSFYNLDKLEGLSLSIDTADDTKSVLSIMISLGSIDGGLYEHGTLQLEIDGKPWVEVTSFAYSKEGDRHFMVETDDDGIPYIIFSNYVSSASIGERITKASCYITKGSSGNVAANSITNVPSIISSILESATIFNMEAAGGGTNYEDIQTLKQNIPLSIRTTGVAITKQDFIDRALLVSGVREVALEYECGKKMTLYVAAANGLIAAEDILESVRNQLKPSLPISTELTVKSVGKNLMVLDIEVIGKRGFTNDNINDEVMTALMTAYAPENSSIGSSVRISDIYALVDNCKSVDYLHLNKFYVTPWPKLIVGYGVMEFSTFRIEKVSIKTTYLIVMTGDSVYTLYSVTGGFIKKNIPISSTRIVDTNNQNTFTMALSGELRSGNKYQFTLSNTDTDYSEANYSVPVIESESQVTLTINTVM